MMARETSLGLWYQQYEVIRKMIMKDMVVSSSVVTKRWLATRPAQLTENQIAWIIARKLTTNQYHMLRKDGGIGYLVNRSDLLLSLISSTSNSG